MAYKCVCGHTTTDHPIIKDKFEFGSCTVCECKSFDFACQACGHDTNLHEFCEEDSKVQCSQCSCRVYIGG